MFFLSGALFPIHILPAWLKYPTYVNPLTYGVDALRSVILGTSAFPMRSDVIILACFAFLMLGIAVKTFERKSIR